MPRKSKAGRGSGKPLSPERKAALAAEQAAMASAAAVDWVPHGHDIYTPELGALIAERLASGKETLRTICEDIGQCSDAAVRLWALDPGHPFYQLYTRAREIGYHAMADDLTDIADDARNDWMWRRGKGGDEFQVIDKEAVDRSKLRVETRKWIISKMLPKIYGDKQEVTMKGDAAFLEMLKHVSGER